MKKCSCELNVSGVPKFNEKEKEKERFFRLRFFCTGAGGRFSKRAFFFSLFAFIAIIYIVYSLISMTFNAELGVFIFGCNAAFGLNYYQNETGKIDNVQRP